MKYLLDTNVCIRVMRGNAQVTARMAQAVMAQLRLAP